MMLYASSVLAQGDLTSALGSSPLLGEPRCPGGQSFIPEVRSSGEVQGPRDGSLSELLSVIDTLSIGKF